LVVDEDFGDGELGDCCHAAFCLAGLVAAETSGPVECVEEAHHYVAAYGFFDALKASSSSQELLESDRQSISVRKQCPRVAYLKLLLSLITL